MGEMKRNKRLLLKAASRIEKIPESYDQRVFGRPEESAPCGTAGCLAGEIIICSERSVKKGVEKLNTLIADWGEASGPWPAAVAGELAGLTYEEQDKLFATASGFSWPSQFRRGSARSRAKTAPKLLRYLAEGGKV